MPNSFKQHVVRRIVLWICGGTVSLVLGAFLCISLWIGADVRATSRSAMRHYPGDSVEALIQFVDDADQSLQERNRAVWALGQLGDQRAIPVLRKHYSGEPCDHAKSLCQHELRKAIKLTEGGVNLTALIWRP